MALYVGQATSIVFKTLPYIFLRFLVTTLFSLSFLLYAGVIFLVGQAMGKIHEAVPWIVWFVGLGVSFPLVRLAREYLLYLVKAGHIAVMAELAIKGRLPEGSSQIQWGKDQVQKRFKGTSLLFLVDRLVAGTIGAINRMMWRVGQVLRGVPGMQGLLKLANTILYFSLTYVDESILARNFVKTEESVWQNAKSGVVLYAQAWREILMTAVVLGLVALLLFPILFFILLGPALGIGALYPSLQIPAIIAASVFTVSLKAAFLDPWMLANMILTYLKTTEGMVPNAEWEAKLENISGKFRQLKEKASHPERSPSAQT